MIVPPEQSSGGILMDKIAFSWLIYTNILPERKTLDRKKASGYTDFIEEYKDRRE